jgi:hypothetical protein
MALEGWSSGRNANYGAENGAAVCRSTLARSWRGRGVRVCTRLDQAIAGRSSIIRSEVHCGLAAPSLAIRRLNGQHSLFLWSRILLADRRIHLSLSKCEGLRMLPFTTSLIDSQVYLT